VVPYLRRTYAAEVERVERWVAHHGGVLLPLETLGDDPRRRKPDGSVNLCAVVWPLAQALEWLVRDVLRGEPLSTCRVAFARELHYREMYDEALAAIARVLADEPAHAEALTLRGDILVHQGRHAEALAVADGVLGAHPEHADAWEVAADALEGLARWAELRAAADRLVDLHRAADERWRLANALLQRALACLRWGDHDAAAADLAAAEALEPTRPVRRRVARLRAELAAAAAPADR
jgi:tetratricopeptide (TPR) repeat protein